MSEWTKHSTRETWARQTALGLATVALRTAAGRQKQWTALVGVPPMRIATGRTAQECMEMADAQLPRLEAERRPTR